MTRSVYFTSYTYGVDAYDKIPEICQPFGKKVLVLGGHKALASVKEKLNKAVAKSQLELTYLWYGGNCTYENIEAIANNPLFQAADMVFGVGGGRALDTTKTLCGKAGKTFFTLPTIASTCAATTSVTVIYDHYTKVFKDVYYSPKPAEHVFIDTEIIANAPYIYMWAGIGDALSKQYESTLSGRHKVLSHTNGMGVQLSGRCSEELMTYGLDALAAVKAKQVTPALERTILEILITTGFVSLLVELDYNSHTAHAIYYGTTVLPQCESHLHGELVAYGVLVLLLLDKQYESFQKVYEFAKASELPTSLKDIEIETQEDLDKLITRAMACNDLKCSPYTVTEDMLRQAILQLEEINAGNIPLELVS